MLYLLSLQGEPPINPLPKGEGRGEGKQNNNATTNSNQLHEGNT